MELKEEKSKIRSKPIYILGISCFYHDSAAALIKDGQLVAAGQEERFTRKKHDDSFPSKAMEYCLQEAGIASAEISYVGFYDKPLLKFERIVSSFISSWPGQYRWWLKSMPIWLKDKLWTKQIIQKNLPGYLGPIYFSEHHLSHAASAFFVSPFQEAAVLTVDGVGEWATASWGIGRDNKITLKKEIYLPDSLGLFYSVITDFLGFKPNSAEYKVMGLAPYGTPCFLDTLQELLAIREDGSFEINKKLLNFYHFAGFDKKLAKLFGFPKRKADQPLEQKHKDVAASLQALTNEAMVKMTRHIQKETGLENLCLAGGVALNCVANSEILKHAGFKHIFIQPAAGDAGGALGVAYYIWHQVLNKPRDALNSIYPRATLGLSKGRPWIMGHCFWGPEFNEQEIESLLATKGVLAEKLTDRQLFTKVAQLIADQKVIGWFQGRMEWGPRALGHRSILADARNKENWQKVNLKIKFRESFRPFAPSVLEGDVADWFEWDGQAPYMLFTVKVKKNSIPAVTHVDGSARLQTVDAETNARYHRLISEFKKLTGCPVIINTSFNIRGEPIVCTPEDAFNTFIKTDLDYLVLGNYLLDKKAVIQRYPFIMPQISLGAD